MAFNIMDMITDQITPDNVGMLSKFLGEDSSLITKGISAAAPLLLGSLLGSTSKPEGVSAFNQALDNGLTGQPGRGTEWQWRKYAGFEWYLHAHFVVGRRYARFPGQGNFRFWRALLRLKQISAGTCSANANEHAVKEKTG